MHKGFALTAYAAHVVLLSYEQKIVALYEAEAAYQCIRLHSKKIAARKSDTGL
jgi:hypothetical protein